MEKNYCVYIHKCINGKIYIGITNNTIRRWRNKGIEYKPKKENTRPFWNAIIKYGWENFEHLIIEENLNENEAKEKEKYYIKKYNSRDREIGYNVAEGGNGGRIYKEHPKGMLGTKQTEKAILASKQNAINAGKNGLNTNWKNGHPKGMLGKTHSEEYKERLKNTPSHKHPSSKKIKIIFPDKKTITFECVKYAKEFLGINSQNIADLIKTGEKYKLPKANMKKEIKEKREKIVGIKIVEIENTEITTKSKKFVVS